MAVDEAEGPRAGLAKLSELDETLPDNHRLPAVRARCAGDICLARAPCSEAMGKCVNEVRRVVSRVPIAATEVALRRIDDPAFVGRGMPSWPCWKPSRFCRDRAAIPAFIPHVTTDGPEGVERFDEISDDPFRGDGAVEDES